MAAPYIEIFQLPQPVAGLVHIASVVINKADFDKFIDDVEATNVIDASSGQRSDKTLFDNIREARVLPMMRRGTKTQTFFERFGVYDADVMCIIERGMGPEIARQLLGIS